MRNQNITAIGTFSRPLCETKRLEHLNALYREMSKVAIDLTDAYQVAYKTSDETALKELQSCYAKIQSAFRKEKDSLGFEVKFDSANGEYFPAKAGKKNLYRFKVIRQYENFFEVEADDAEEAERLARNAIAEDGMSVARTVAENVGR